MKPPVVVIGRHCKTNQCWIAVRFKKIQSVAKISQKSRRERADEVRANEFHGRNCLFSPRMRALLSKVLSLRPRRRLCAGNGGSRVSAPNPDHHAAAGSVAEPAVA